MIIKYIYIENLPKEEIENLIAEHDKAPQLRILQKRLASEVTTMVHGDKECKLAIATSEVLFGNCTTDVLKSLDEDTFVNVFNGVPTFEINKDILLSDIKLTDLAVDNAHAFKSKGELRKLITNGGISINKNKISNDLFINSSELIHDKFIVIQQGKKNYRLIVAR